MKVLFAVSNESISNSIIKKYSQTYKEIISGKNVYYFNAILKELQKDKTYDRIVISEDLEPFTNNNFDTIDNFIFDKLDSISDEATNTVGEDIPIILIATDRRGKSDAILVKLFGIGVYSTLIGQDRSIEEVCKLLNKPRTKKEAKVYYQLDSGEVEYNKENESDVSETEIQNILNHYKKLGKNEEKYVESFDSIAAQYTDAQLKLIIKVLPINVKAVLEANSPKYQQIVFYGASPKNAHNIYEPPKINKKEDKSGIKVESILENTGTKKITKPVIIPGTVSTKNVKKADTTAADIKKLKEESKQEEVVIEEPEVEEVEELKQKPVIVPDVKQVVVTPVKKGRGRPRKVQPVVSEESNDVNIEALDELVSSTASSDVSSEPEVKKKGRGRPRKVVAEPIPEPIVEEKEDIVVEDKEDNAVNLFGLDDEQEKEEDTVLPGFEELDFDEDVSTPMSNSNSQGTILPGFDEENDNEEEQEQEEYTPINTASSMEPNSFNNNVKQEELITNKSNNYVGDSTSLLSNDKKIVAFVGTSKNGTSFLVSNLAELLSSQGIRTAILDLTKNKNSYYVYTKNEEELRKTAFECMDKLANGVAEGIKVNKSLDVYTCLPGEESYYGKSREILQTLANNYSLVLMDCDFDSEYEYMSAAQEIYLVQSMDILTIQPLTAYLRNLKAKNILSEEKLRVVINKDLRVRGVTEKAIIGGMSCYNDPAMSFMTELFNRDTIRFAIIPFDINAYSKYLEGLVNCLISLNGYSKDFLTALRKLSNMVYPLINGKDKNNKYNGYNRF